MWQSLCLTLASCILQLFFSFMALVLLGVKYKSDKRDQYLHHGNWMVKLGLWLLFSALPFFFPNGLINMYGAQTNCNQAQLLVGSGVWHDRSQSSCAQA